MNKSLVSLIMSTLTLGLNMLGFVAAAHATAPLPQPIESSTTAPTFPTSQAPTAFSPTQDNLKIADIGVHCETYWDGSWACCALDSYGNWYCEYGE